MAVSGDTVAKALFCCRGVVKITVSLGSDRPTNMVLQSLAATMRWMLHKTASDEFGAKLRQRN